MSQALGQPIQPASGEYVFLMRHAEHRDGVLTVEATGQVQQVGMRFAEWLDGEMRCTPTLRMEVRVTSAPEVRATATELIRSIDASLTSLRKAHAGFNWPQVVLPDVDCEPTKLIGIPDYPVDPRTLGAYRPDRAEIDKLVEDASANPGESLLIVGNDPFMGWLASALTHHPTSIARGELLCLKRQRRLTRERWHLIWNLAAEDSALLQDVQAKIKSKMDTAKTFGAVVVALATFILTQALPRATSGWLWASMATLGASAGLYFATLFQYDSLLMPPRFWGNHSPSHDRRRLTIRRRASPFVRRPPGSTERLLHDAMIHTWTWLFLPATLLAGLSVVLMTANAAAAQQAPHPSTIIGAALVLTVAVAAWVIYHRPRLGASD